MIVIVKVIVVIFIPTHPWREFFANLLQLINDSVAHRQLRRHQYLLALGIMDLLGMSIASILLGAVIPADIWLTRRLNLLKHRFLIQVRKISQGLHYYIPEELARVRYAALEMKLYLLYQKIEVLASPLVPLISSCDLTLTAAINS